MAKKLVFSFLLIKKFLRRVYTPEAIKDVREAFTRNPHLSTRHNPFVKTGDTDLDEEDHNTTCLFRIPLRRIIKKDLRLKLYHLQIAYVLVDYAARVVFAQKELRRLEAHPDLLGNLFFHEAHFYLDGGVNRHD